jgi:hypothetical protein
LTVGEKDDPEPVRGVLDKLARFRPTLPRWLHKERQSVYIEIARGLFQNSTGGRYFDNCNVVIYRGEDGRHWVRLQSEFDDGRFEPAT